MAEEIQYHGTSVSWVVPPPAEVDANDKMTLQLSVACPLGCDLSCHRVRILDEKDEQVAEMELPWVERSAVAEGQSADASFDTYEIAVRAPVAPGEHTWRAWFPAQICEGIQHADDSASVSFQVKPHRIRMNVWDVPTPVVLGSKFVLKAGLQCSAGCDLGGEAIEIVDEQGVTLGSAVLGGKPWTPSGSLYWAEIELQAPASKGVYDWSARPAASRSNRERHPEFEHRATTFPVTFAVASPPDHRVSIEVVEQKGRTPVGDAHVTLLPKEGAPYRSRTDEFGRATLEVARGHYDVFVVKMDHKDHQSTADIDGDTTIAVDLLYRPDPMG